MPACFWTLFFVLQHPDARAAVAAELHTVTGVDPRRSGPDSGGGGSDAAALGPEVLDRLEVLGSCVTEALRLTSGSIVMREVSPGGARLLLPANVVANVKATRAATDDPAARAARQRLLLAAADARAARKLEAMRAAADAVGPPLGSGANPCSGGTAAARVLAAEAAAAREAAANAAACKAAAAEADRAVAEGTEGLLPTTVALRAGDRAAIFPPLLHHDATVREARRARQSERAGAGRVHMTL